ncbi:MAG: hypothetical protein KGL39_19665, partial [Patescibacteria group bacterium]|nr:hypothetical protein [Patescibacteria group bacterium]
DLEWVEDPGAWKRQPNDVNEANLKTFISRLEAAGFHVRIYTSYEFIVGNLPKTDWLAKYDLWVADYSSHPFAPKLPPMWTKWWAWQDTGNGTIAGIDGPVDISYLNDGATI